MNTKEFGILVSVKEFLIVVCIRLFQLNRKHLDTEGKICPPVDLEHAPVLWKLFVEFESIVGDKLGGIAQCRDLMGGSKAEKRGALPLRIVNISRPKCLFKCNYSAPEAKHWGLPSTA